MSWARSAVLGAAGFAALGALLVAVIGTRDEVAPVALLMAAFGAILGPVWRRGAQREADERATLDRAREDPRTTEHGHAWIERLAAGERVQLPRTGLRPLVELDATGVTVHFWRRTPELVRWTEMTSVSPILYSLAQTNHVTHRVIQIRRTTGRAVNVPVSKDQLSSLLVAISATASTSRGPEASG